jgi:hypothetical protein
MFAILVSIFMLLVAAHFVLTASSPCGVSFLGNMLSPSQRCQSTVATMTRTLQVADWAASVDAVSGQSFSFSTGPGGGSNPNIKVHIHDLCRSEAASRSDVGYFYPSPTVTGISVNNTDVVNDPGSSNTITYTFEEGIEGNADIYTDNEDNTATVEFCAEIGLYDNTTLINFAEVKLTYDVNLTTTFTNLTGYAVTQAGAFTDGGEQAVSFDGTVEAYFCNPTTHDILPNDGSTINQGSLISVCFEIPDGQFEVKDVTDLTVERNIDGIPSQAVVTDSNIFSASTQFATKTCTDTGTTDTNICVITLLLMANFFQYSEFTLTGSGNLLLELGDSSGGRRHLRHPLRMADTAASASTTSSFNLSPYRFVNEDYVGDTGR